MIRVIAPERGRDPGGNGRFGAPRGTRLHMGIDYNVSPGSQVLSPVDGHVTKLGYPYGDDLSYRYVQITTQGRYEHRLFYVLPAEDLVVGNRVETNTTVLGTAQDVSTRYPIPRGMAPHVHYEIRDQHGLYINPEALY